MIWFLCFSFAVLTVLYLALPLAVKKNSTSVKISITVFMIGFMALAFGLYVVLGSPALTG